MPILTTVFVTQSITLLYGAKGTSAGPLQIVNLSSSNTLYLSTTSNPISGQPGVFPLSPLSSLSFDGSVAIYGITDGTGTGIVIAGIVPGGEGYSPGALAISGPVTATISGPVSAVVTGNVNANVTNASLAVTGNVGITGTPSVTISGTPAVSISGTPNVAITSGNLNANITNATLDIFGVGGYVLPGNINTLFTGGPTSIPASSNIQPIVLADVSQYNSYDLAIAVSDTSMNTNGHAHAFTVRIDWYDDLVSNRIIFTEQWSPWVSFHSSGDPVTATGPMHGHYMTVTVTNPSTVGAITMTYMSMFGSGRSTALSEWRQPATQANFTDGGVFTALNNVGADFDNVLSDTNGFITLVAATSYIILIGLYAGPTDWEMSLGANIVITRANIVNLGSNGSTQTSGNLNAQNNVLEVLTAPAGTQQGGSQILPRAACALLVVVGGVGGQIAFNMIAQQGP